MIGTKRSTGTTTARRDTMQSQICGGQVVAALFAANDCAHRGFGIYPQWWMRQLSAAAVVAIHVVRIVGHGGSINSNILSWLMGCVDGLMMMFLIVACSSWRGLHGNENENPFYRCLYSCSHSTM